MFKTHGTGVGISYAMLGVTWGAIVEEGLGLSGRFAHYPGGSLKRNDHRPKSTIKFPLRNAAP